MTWGEGGGLILGLAALVTAIGGWIKIRGDAKRESKGEDRSEWESHLARQDIQISRQAEEIKRQDETIAKQDAKIDAMRKEHRAEMDSIRREHSQEMLAVKRRQDFWETRVREVFDYAYLLREHIAEGKPPPPPPWPSTLLSTAWKGDNP